MLDDKFNLLEYCVKEAELHGKKADNTLECIGINTENGRVFKTKKYYLGAKRQRVELLNTEPCKTVYEKLKKGLFKTSGVKLFEVAKFDTFDANVYAMSFETAAVKREDIPELIRVFAELSGENLAFTENFLQDFEAAKAYLSEDMPPVIQLGIQLDEQGRILSTKYYIVTKKARNLDACMSDELMQLIEATGRKTACEFLWERSKLLEKYGYKPGIMGVNTYKDGSKKQKLYYDSGAAYEQSCDVCRNSAELAEKLGLGELFNENFISQLYSAGLYVRGIGLNLAREEEIRFYLDQV